MRLLDNRKVRELRAAAKNAGGGDTGVESRHDASAATLAGRLLLTPDEAAETLGVSLATLRRLKSRGRIRYCRVGRLTRYRPEELTRFIAENECRAGDTERSGGNGEHRA